MPHHHLLPQHYCPAGRRGDRLHVGQLVYALYWGSRYKSSAVQECFLWRVTVQQPGYYALQAVGINKTMLLTPDLAGEVGLLPANLSERLRIEDYPTQLADLHAHGIGAYFIEALRGRVELILVKRRLSHRRHYLLPTWVVDAQRNPVLMQQWLEQALWCALHPRKADALIWAANEGAESFGRWPELRSPAELDAEAKEALPAYRNYQAWCKANPPTEEELRRAEIQRWQPVFEYNKNLQLAREIQEGKHDEQLLPSIHQLIGEAGIRPAGV